MAYIDFHTHQKPRSNRIFNLMDKAAPNSSHSFGINPWYLKENWKIKIIEIENQIQDTNHWAIGECGFDLIKGPEEKIQLEAFMAQAKLAKKHEA